MPVGPLWPRPLVWASGWPGPGSEKEESLIHSNEKAHEFELPTVTISGGSVRVLFSLLFSNRRNSAVCETNRYKLGPGSQGSRCALHGLTVPHVHQLLVHDKACRSC